MQIEPWYFFSWTFPFYQLPSPHLQSYIAFLSTDFTAIYRLPNNRHQTGPRLHAVVIFTVSSLSTPLFLALLKFYCILFELKRRKSRGWKTDTLIIINMKCKLRYISPLFKHSKLNGQSLKQNFSSSHPILGNRLHDRHIINITTLTRNVSFSKSRCALR
jgi:hypothetical protein